MKTILFSLAIVLSVTAFSQDSLSPQPALPFLSDYAHVRDFALSADQSEAYFTLQSPNEEIAVIVTTKWVNGNWTTPVLVSFTGKYRDIEPFLSPDGKRLYFSSNRPLADSTSPAKDYDIWYVERKEASAQWSQPVNLGKPVNTAANEFYPSVAANGNLYFTSDAGALLNKDDIYYAKWEKGKYGTPVPLERTINSEGYEFNAYITPDERFLIYTAYARKDGFGSGDLYMSHRDDKGNWEKAINMGEKVNSPAMDYCPFLDMKSEMLYFTSKRSSIEPHRFTSLNDFLQSADQYENGLSRLYKVHVAGW